MHDPRVGRFFAVDPLTKQYAHNSPYAFSENSVIAFIELEGLEKAGPTYMKNNVHYVTLFKPWVSPVLRTDDEYFTDTAISLNTSNKIEYTINAQQYEQAAVIPDIPPGDNSDWRSQGQTIKSGKVITGRSSTGTFYFAINNQNGVSFGKGNPPKDSKLAVGGGVPIIINGLPYGEKNEYSDGAPAGLPEYGDPGKDNQKYLTQRSNTGYGIQNKKEIGKSILAWKSKDSSILLIVQEHGIQGMTMDEIRNDLIAKGYDNAISFDGSTSATLVKDTKIVVEPSYQKDGTIPSGIMFQVEKK